MLYIIGGGIDGVSHLSCDKWLTMDRSGWQDLNLRPHAPQTRTLTGLSYTPLYAFRLSMLLLFSIYWLQCLASLAWTATSSAADSRCSCYSAFSDCNALLLSLGLQHPRLPTLNALAIQHLLTCNALLFSLGLQHPRLPTLNAQLRLAMPSTCNWQSIVHDFYRGHQGLIVYRERYGHSWVGWSRIRVQR